MNAWIMDAYQWVTSYMWIKPMAVLLASATVGSTLPLLIIAYEKLRLTVRKERLRKKIGELDLEGQYLTIFQSAEIARSHEKKAKSMEQPAGDAKSGRYDFKSEAQIRAFEETFEKDFNRLYGLGSYTLPLSLTIATSIVFGLIYFGVLGEFPPFVALPINGILVLSIAGALLGLFPSYVACYASTSLNANSLLSLIGKVWLSVALGFVLATNATDTLKLPTAFLGSLLPVMTLEALKDAVFVKALVDKFRNQDDEKSLNIKQMLEVLDQDEDMLGQLQFMGIRSVRSLAYANPLVMFMETDMNFSACVDLVDRAVLSIYIPDPDVRKAVNKLGIRTTVDMMTLLRDDYGDGQGFIWLSPGSSDTPAKVVGALVDLQAAMQLPSINSLYNILDMMRDDPQLRCLFDLWDRVDEVASKSMAAAKWNFTSVPHLRPGSGGAPPEALTERPPAVHLVAQGPIPPT